MYADFGFYRDTYKGTLGEAEFIRLSVRAAAEIDRMTLNRAKSAMGDDLTAVEYAQCAVVDELSYQGTGGTGDVTSESNDGISRSYASVTAKSSRQRIDAAAYTWLCNTDLLFAGV